ncbi:GspH/FimT family pseudopilin [Thermosyntropha sp.]|uniref:GspH/FimT family pseudopilin n=1 Tax=Thermosyntropha sp. TaxID=2740820 RepID=UPI0025E38B3C|nr:GspH/FimT family pseudopilin [Thermosyntropha sp.]MBO8159258.1 prepilin-type N-terminal cleavage/methylation domain-containing protein [Thermosyntropha sp.]
MSEEERVEKGFTIVELLCVLIIVSFMLFMAFPHFEKVKERYELKTEAQKMAWVLRSARQEAILSGISQSVYFYPLVNKYKDHKGEWHELPSTFKMGVNFTTFAGRPACVFSPEGAPDGGTVTLISRSQFKQYIIVSPVTGRVRVSQYPPQYM